jgi:hypothetical protein
MFSVCAYDEAIRDRKMQRWYHIHGFPLRAVTTTTATITTTTNYGDYHLSLRGWCQQQRQQQQEQQQQQQQKYWLTMTDEKTLLPPSAYDQDVFHNRGPKVFNPLHS